MGEHLFIGRNELIRPKREMNSHRQKPDPRPTADPTAGKWRGGGWRREKSLSSLRYTLYLTPQSTVEKNRARTETDRNLGFRLWRRMGKRHGKPPQKPYPGNRGLVSALFTNGPSAAARVGVLECEGEWLGVDRTCLPSAVCATVRVETCTLPYLVPLPLVPSRLGVDLVVGAVRLEPLREALQLRLLRLDVGARLTAARRGRRLAERLRRQESSGAGKL